MGWGGECVTHLSTASSWVGVQTGVHGFDSRTPHKPVVSKTAEADIWLSSNDHLTDEGGQWAGCQQLWQRKVGGQTGIFYGLAAIGTWGYPIRACEQCPLI